MPHLRSSTLPNCLALSYSFLCKTIHYGSAHSGPSSKRLCWGALTCPPDRPLPGYCWSKGWPCHVSPPTPSTTAAHSCMEAPEQPLDQDKGVLVPPAVSGWRLLSLYYPCQDSVHDMLRTCWISEAFTHVFVVVLPEHRADSNSSAVCRLANSGQTLNSKARGSPWSVLI